MESSQADCQSYPNRSPEEYIGILTRSNLLTEPLIRKAIRYLGLFDGCRVLDVPSGIGYHSIWMVEENRTINVVGADKAEEHLHYARELAIKKNMNSRVTFQAEDIRWLSFADNSFDFLWCCNGLWPGSPELGCIAREPYQMVDELKRVLKPGGVMSVLFWTSHKLLPGYPLLESALNATLAANHILPGDYIKPELHIMRAAQWLKQAGLAEVKVKTFVLDVAGPFSEEETGSMAQILHTLYGKAKKELLPEQRQKADPILDPNNEKFILRQDGYSGFVTYTMFTGSK